MRHCDYFLARFRPADAVKSRCLSRRKKVTSGKDRPPETVVLSKDPLPSPNARQRTPPVPTVKLAPTKYLYVLNVLEIALLFWDLTGFVSSISATAGRGLAGLILTRCCTLRGALLSLCRGDALGDDSCRLTLEKGACVCYLVRRDAKRGVRQQFCPNYAKVVTAATPGGGLTWSTNRPTSMFPTLPKASSEGGNILQRETSFVLQIKVVLAKKPLRLPRLAHKGL